MTQKDEGQGLLSEAASQSKGALVGAVTVALAVPFLGWIVGVGVGAFAVVGSAGYSWHQKRQQRKLGKK